MRGVRSAESDLGEEIQMRRRAALLGASAMTVEFGCARDETQELIAHFAAVRGLREPRCEERCGGSGAGGS